MGRRGLVGLFTTHGAKVRGFESRLLLFFFRRGHPSAQRRKRIGRTNNVERGNAKNARAAKGRRGTGRRTWREEMRKASVHQMVCFEDD